MLSPLIQAHELRRLLEQREGTPPAVLDIRWRLDAGPQPREYERGHIPGAAFVDLERELAAAPGRRGRHPLPDPEDFGRSMRRAGVGGGREVVVYDDAGGLPAARAWWLLRHHGHPDVAVLDGGLGAWVAAGGELAAGPEQPATGDFKPRPGDMRVLDADGAAALAGGGGVLLDARAPERFSGAAEPLDPVAGHIPGARNWPMARNLDAEGRFLTPAALREAFAPLSGQAVGAYCGSGITAAHTVLALELAGIDAAMYPGSWSEWVADPRRPVAVGVEPRMSR